MRIRENLQAIQDHIQEACKKSGRQTNEITIIAVTKYVTIERAKEAIESGIIHLAENRTDGFLEKYEEIKDDAKWHFIGTLQSRKTRDVVNKVVAIHSLDRKSLAKEIEKRAEKRVDCFVQVNVSEEESKHGLAVKDVIPFIKHLENYEKIRVVGLMTMAPHTDDEDEIRRVFRKLRQLRDDVRSMNLPYAPCLYLSMGMSNDYKIAIEEGATHIRIGSRLVGQ
ncbi:MAG TPA: YggS family pyridoxal phosphate-dependent enzyme [Cerasibacillus sp.]|uniref:YggS family pyridoxal phosphate-dependent enzyme n=1 Tax=Cerasibacillus sp. TaxID=2498711 RepID=UPI002F4076B9